MAITSRVSLCRICLEGQGTIPIFENMEKNDSVYTKLSLCLGEAMEDLYDYPKNICKLCQITLNTAYNFIKKYQSSCATLASAKHIIKEEIIELSDSDVDNSENFDYDVGKLYPKIEFDDARDFLERLKPIELKSEVTVASKSNVKAESKSKVKAVLKSKVKAESNSKVKTKPKIKLCKVKKPKAQVDIKKRSGTINDRIASSILEGDFVWRDNSWCLHSELTKVEKKGADTPKEQIEKPKANIKLRNESRLCDLCGEIFKSQDALRTHTQRVHTQKKLPCPLCPKTFLQNHDLNRHKNRVHSLTPKNHVCAICGNRFHTPSDLNKHHKQIHDKTFVKKKYECKLCDKKFSAAKSVVMHERSVHTGERPAQCTVCDKRFYHNDYLKEHMRLHTGEVPFKCPICGRGYAQRGNMKSHIKHNHKLSHLDPVTLSLLKPSYLKFMKS